MNRQLKYIVAIAMCVFMCSLAAAEQSLDRSLRIAVVNRAPGVFTDKNGQLLGARIEISRKIAEEAGFNFEIVLLPYPRILLEMKQGEIDMALLVPNEQLRKIATPLAHIVDVELILLGQKSAAISTIDDIEGKRVAYLSDSAIVKNITGNMDILREKGIKFEHLVKMLVAKRVDAIIGPKNYIFNVLEELDYPEGKLGKPISIYTAKVYLVYAEKNSDKKIIARFKAATEKLKREKVIQTILDKYNY